MKRRFEGLHQASDVELDVPEGLLLVRVTRAQYRWHAQKPYYSLRLTVLEPNVHAGASVMSRVYCTPKALWKLNWFLRDFGYDTNLLGHDEIEDKHLVGLQGVVKIRRVVMNGAPFINLDAFAPASQWEELTSSRSPIGSSEAAR